MLRRLITTPCNGMALLCRDATALRHGLKLLCHNATTPRRSKALLCHHKTARRHSATGYVIVKMGGFHPQR